MTKDLTASKDIPEEDKELISNYVEKSDLEMLSENASNAVSEDRPEATSTEQATTAANPPLAESSLEKKSEYLSEDNADGEKFISEEKKVCDDSCDLNVNNLDDGDPTKDATGDMSGTVIISQQQQEEADHVKEKENTMNASNQNQPPPAVVNDNEQKPELVTLPMDSLHHIASYLKPCEWLTFAQCNRASNNVFREIIRRVKLHGFKCATEVVTAWKLGHHSDAKELVALYIQSGVPIYPRSLGHSYHTLIWKMQVEAREMIAQPNSTEKIDQFYLDRSDFRVAEDYAPEITYVEEKCFYWTTKAIDNGKTRSPSRSRRGSNRSTTSSEATGRPASPVFSDTESIVVDRIPVRVHQHLLDQHSRKKHCVNDNDGLMITPGISLSADFYHPTSGSRNQSQVFMDCSLTDLQSIPESIEPNPTEESEDAAPPQELDAVEPVDVADADDLLVAQDSSLTERRRPPSPDKVYQALLSCEVETYTASLETSLTVDDVKGSHELRKHLRSRFTTYQRRLETCLAQMDNSGFEECILDFWDEFFPHSAYIQYYDLHTAVPRVSCLHKFLTRPCPKAIGIVQCEIERIKITSRGKGVSMKGRLFPTYEYRLFIRHRPHNQSPESALATEDDDGFIRRDTVLMVAKNRGRKHTEIAGVGSTKKGSNNYFLYMPQQIDVDAHYNKFNNLPEPSKMNPNGASLDPVIVSEESSSVLMGRLQSNFIGTEFQIFTPRQKKRSAVGPQVAKTVYSPSDDEIDYDSGFSSDNNSCRRSRLGRFRLGSSHGFSESSTEMSTTRTRARSAPRSISASDSSRRPNRRAIANVEGVSSQPNMSEEEDGVITYTANLLGSRPRIMDVCIPKVSSDGVAGTEWRRYLDSVEEPEEGRMLSCFRQLLQRLENLDPQQPRQDGGDGAQEPQHGGREDSNPLFSNGEDFGLVPLQNRPPWWNVELGSFVLNFGGRVSVASVKNFQLCDRNDQDNIMLQFGRIHGRHSFTMDFQYPLTAVQAFSIAISSLQSKISFG